MLISTKNTGIRLTSAAYSRCEWVYHIYTKKKVGICNHKRDHVMTEMKRKRKLS